MHYTLLISIFLISFFADSSVFKCDINGVLTFSQFPCSDNAQQIEIKTPKPSANNKTLSSEQTHSEIDNFIQLRQIEKKMTKSDNLIRSYQDKMTEEVNTLNNKLTHIAKKPSGDLYDFNQSDAIAKQLNNVISRYNSLINVEQQKLIRLSAQKQHIKSSKVFLDNNSTNEAQLTDKFIKMSKIENKIRIHENKIRTFQQKMDLELKAIDAHLSTAHVNAAQQNSFTIQMTAITANYNTQINIQQKQIDRLINEKAFINR
ncbi:DUF4124 domain-containing protein [Pseudoalteromonas denitrificans]|uniref:DUF4124 domain-containing protein n=1 Tax=Pseudoalteromonas denitrificans DSM 6059 TaxID=1123010 RepID=A0A1I1TJH0_9GAMM|nr:DUF4124 domain-containing protein [Pseudoalteromonas denitrificans]SFD58724.1 hypothetical protein SAMN02745724_04912 [Pseudoalteromonas denitrificans DSM 6059]